MQNLRIKQTENETKSQREPDKADEIKKIKNRFPNWNSKLVEKVYQCISAKTVSKEEV